MDDDSKGQKKDPVWKYTKTVDEEKYFRCKFCNQVCSGTIHRLKQHLAHAHKGMKACLKVPDEIKLEVQNLLKKHSEDKIARNEMLYEIGMGAGSGCQSDTSPLIENENYGLGGSTPSCGVRRVPTQPPKPRGPMDKFATSEARQSTLNSKWKQDERKEVCRKIGRFIFARALPFNTVNDPYWAIAVEGIANYGPGFKPPSMHELRTWVLKDEVDDINRMMEEHKKAWKEHGCSIMSDGWTDGKNRVLINFLVNSPAGTWFLKSVDASDTIKNADLMFNYLDGVIDEIGEANVVQVEGIKVRAIVLFDPKFWSNVAFCIKTTMPLVVVLREVDSEERPAMGYIYELMDSAKEKIAFNCANNAKKYTPIWNKIDARWTPQLHRPLHAAGYYLNPQLRYRDNFSNVDEIHTKKRNRLEHKRLNALVYVKYNTKLRERSIKRRQNIDPILVDEIDSDDEWIAEKEDPVLPIGGSWLEDEELFDVDAIRTVPITPYERSEDTRSTITNTIDIGSSSTAKKRKVNQISTSSK
ncbi:hypothetical protein RHMOL_Rhmol02G0217700 [Rhododendron molle]|uniref:Uncharacterized protein n=1 Tax=Rhododendron molle TaxID=49168 RepID=A0ACC0PVT5_RHOML|nr:hypothetical protein RHMOL_Rhmol02G0217700 [Rhododendron molle]